MRPVATVSGAEAAAAADSVGCVAAASRECAGMQLVALRCNGLRYAATDAAVWAQQEGDISGKRPKRECTCSRTCPSGSLYGKRAAEWPCCAAAAMSAPSLLVRIADRIEPRLGIPGAACPARAEHTTLSSGRSDSARRVRRLRARAQRRPLRGNKRLQGEGATSPTRTCAGSGAVVFQGEPN